MTHSLWTVRFKLHRQHGMQLKQNAGCNNRCPLNSFTESTFRGEIKKKSQRSRNTAKCALNHNEISHILSFCARFIKLFIISEHLVLVGI